MWGAPRVRLSEIFSRTGALEASAVIYAAFAIGHPVSSRALRRALRHLS